MITGPLGRTLIQDFEKCALHAYRDGGGVWTIGWGATGKGVGPGVVWSQHTADLRFESDLAIREAQLNKLLNGAPTTQGQYDALMSFGYNCGMGEGGLKTSTLLRLHKAGEYALAAKQFARWNKDNGKVVRGLTRRREAERLLYLSKD